MGYTTFHYFAFAVDSWLYVTFFFISPSFQWQVHSEFGGGAVSDLFHLWNNIMRVEGCKMDEGWEE